MIKNYKKSLIEPLEGDELHIFHSNRNIDRLINQLLEVIKNEIHGCYLVGGLRGAGKTSFVNLCCAKYSSSRLIKIDLNCSRFINHNNFIYFFIEEMVKATEKFRLSNDLKAKIKDLHDRVIFKNVNKVNKLNINKEGSNDSCEQIESTKFTVKVTFFDKIFDFLKSAEKNNKSKVEKNSSMEYCETFELEVRNDEFIIIDKLSKVLKCLAETHQVILTIDEIDKQDDEFLKRLFDSYKNLFLNLHVISIFIVDQSLYRRFTFSSEVDNKLKSYFIKAFYLSTFEFDDIKSYLYREFEVYNLAEVHKVAYLLLMLTV